MKENSFDKLRYVDNWSCFIIYQDFILILNLKLVLLTDLRFHLPSQFIDLTYSPRCSHFKNWCSGENSVQLFTLSLFFLKTERKKIFFVGFMHFEKFVQNKSLNHVFFQQNGPKLHPQAKFFSVQLCD
jgi:hypothetical protein